MDNVLIGTTSWTDKTLIASGLFYPRNVKSAEARLRYYANQFAIVEVDSSYYAMPSERNSLLWVERTPTEFVFDIKAFRLFTQHQTPLSALPADIREELESMVRYNWPAEQIAGRLQPDCPGLTAAAVRAYMALYLEELEG